MKKFTIPCNFGPKKAPFDVYIGMPGLDRHPLEFQSLWLNENRGGAIPPEVMESFEKLLALSRKNNISFEELCVYALEAANEEKKRNSEEQPNPAAASDLDEAQLLLGGNSVHVLADANQLTPFFDEPFNLLFIICHGRDSTVYHAVILCKEAVAGKLVNEVKNRNITVEQLPNYGKLEHVGKGSKLPVEVNMVIRRKYS